MRGYFQQNRCLKDIRTLEKPTSARQVLPQGGCVPGALATARKQLLPCLPPSNGFIALGETVDPVSF